MEELAVIYESPGTYRLIPPSTPVDTFIEQWLHGRPESTQQAYRSDAARFLLFLNDRPLNQIILADLQEFTDTLGYLKPASRASILKGVKSLFTFAEKTGYLAFNIGAAIRLPKVKRKLAERILSEMEIYRILENAEGKRNHALIRFLYVSGARVSEACRLTWRDFQDRDNGRGQVTLDGKGDKERTILLPIGIYQELRELRQWESSQRSQPVGLDEPVFISRKKGHLDPSQVHRIVESIAVKAEVQIYQGAQRRTNRKTGKEERKTVMKSRVSPHYFRHAHASHALDHNVPPHVVQATLGHASLATTTLYSHARPDTSSSLALNV